jgi:exodeoxyribonuclease V alpha subunit
LFDGFSVEKFGADTLTIIEESPGRLIEVEGIGNKRVSMIRRAWNQHKEIKTIMIFLQEHGVSAVHAVKIFKAYGNRSIAVVKENPYKLADDIWGIGFKTADTIARKMGFDSECYYRCRSGLLYILNEFANDGHCDADREALVNKAAEILEIDEGKLWISVDAMRHENEIFYEKQHRVYLLPLYFSEKGVAERLWRIMSAPRKSAVADVEASIDRAEKAAGKEAAFWRGHERL